MKKNEVRHGNLVIYGDYQTTIDEKDIIHFVWFSDKYEPIPLTDEWLLKFGLEKLDIDLYKIDNEYFILFFSETYYIADEDWQNKKRIIGKGLIYVHQLQNLYFALTGEELTI